MATGLLTTAPAVAAHGALPAGAAVLRLTVLAATVGALGTTLARGAGAARAAAGMRRLVAVAVLVIGLVACALAVAGTAAAHATRIGTDPAENTQLTTSPSRVSATFNEAMLSEFATMTVVGPDGNLWSTGEPTVDGAVVSVGVRPLGPTGTYTVNYRATSADGHVVSGSWSFGLTVAGTGTPGPSAASTSEPASQDGVAVWPFYVGAAVIVGAGAVWALRRRM